MKNKIIKVILLFAIVLTVFCNCNVQANSSGIRDPLKNPDAYDNIIKEGPEEKALEDMTGTILGVVNTVGVVASVLVLMVMGIKYMTGSIEEKAEYKKTMSTYVIGAVLLFGIPTIANVLYNIGKSI